MEVATKTGPQQHYEYGPSSAILDDFMDAVGRQDANAARAAFDQLVEVKGDAKSALASIQGRNPRNGIFRGPATPERIAQAEANLTPDQVSKVQAILGSYDSIVSGLKGAGVVSAGGGGGGTGRERPGSITPATVQPASIGPTAGAGRGVGRTAGVRMPTGRAGFGYNRLRSIPVRSVLGRRASSGNRLARRFRSPRAGRVARLAPRNRLRV